MSFRATLKGNKYTDRGFKIKVNSIQRIVEILFNPKKTDKRHHEWLKIVKKYHGKDEKAIAYWKFDTQNS